MLNLFVRGVDARNLMLVGMTPAQMTRNLGSRIGIALVTTFLGEGLLAESLLAMDGLERTPLRARESERLGDTQINHAGIAARVSPFGHVPLPAGLDIAGSVGLATLNGEITRQASAIGFLNDFWRMMWLTIAAIPLLLLFRKPARRMVVPLPSADH